MSDSTRKLRLVLTENDPSLKSDDLFQRRANGQVTNQTVYEPGVEVVLSEDLKPLGEFSCKIDKLYGGLACIGLMLDDKLSELQADISQVQHGIDQINYKLDRNQCVKLERVQTHLRRADEMGESAGAYLRTKEDYIDEPLLDAEKEIIGLLSGDVADAAIHTGLLRRLLLIRQLRAKICLVCGYPKEAHNLLEEARTFITRMARSLLVDWTRGVTLTDLPQAQTPDGLKRLLNLMQIVDGKDPLDRLLERCCDAPKMPPEFKRHVLPATYTAEGGINVQPAEQFDRKLVYKGQLIARQNGFNSIAPASGCFIWEQDWPAKGFVIELPVPTSPIPDLFDRILELADLIVSAEELDTIGGLAARFEAAAKLLGQVSEGRPKGALVLYEERHTD